MVGLRGSWTILPEVSTNWETIH